MTLDNAHALHYAIAYCDSKTTTELLDIELADVNLRNLRGYTGLHVAALRTEPKIIVLSAPQYSGRFNLTTQFSYYKEVLYMPDYENSPLPHFRLF
ncbi:Regulatory protein [Nymphaea thermarum]|nr:Regulatory protein [Nymphaea thermarum]